MQDNKASLYPDKESDAFIQLTGDVYEAALDPGLWAEAIRKVIGFVGGAAGCLMTRDAFSGKGSVLHAFGDQSHYRKLYFDTYIHIDPISPAISSLQPGEVVSSSSVMPRDEFLKTRFYREWMQPQGWLDNACVMLDRTPSKFVVFAVRRGNEHGWVDDGVHRRMQLIASHLRRCVLAGKAMQHRSVQAARLADALDGIEAAVFFVDAESRILHANANGAALLAEGVLAGAVITGHKGSEDAAGKALLEAFIRARRNGVAQDHLGVCTPLKSPDGAQYVLHALPLASNPRATGASHRAVAVLFVQKAAIGSTDAAEAITRQFRLTPMELRVLQTIIEVGSAPGTATALGIAETTVRTHLSRLFAKTGTTRQLDLAKLVAGFSGGLSR